jgi:hypothetical protein
MALAAASSAATAVTTTATTARAMAAVTSQNLVAVTAQEGNANDREKDRDSENQCTIHPRFLQQKLNRYRTQKNSNVRPSS